MTTGHAATHVLVSETVVAVTPLPRVRIPPPPLRDRRNALSAGLRWERTRRSSFSLERPEAARDGSGRPFHFLSFPRVSQERHPRPVGGAPTLATRGSAARLPCGVMPGAEPRSNVLQAFADGFLEWYASLLGLQSADAPTLRCLTSTMLAATPRPGAPIGWLTWPLARGRPGGTGGGAGPSWPAPARISATLRASRPRHCSRRRGLASRRGGSPRRSGTPDRVDRMAGGHQSRGDRPRGARAPRSRCGRCGGSRGR